MTVIRDEKQKHELVMRLKRAEGQLRAIQGMIEAGEDCERVTQQLSAVRRALDKAFFNVLACALQAPPPKGKDPAQHLEHAAALLAKFG